MPNSCAFFLCHFPDAKDCSSIWHQSLSLRTDKYTLQPSPLTSNTYRFRTQHCWASRYSCAILGIFHPVIVAVNNNFHYIYVVTCKPERYVVIIQSLKLSLCLCNPFASALKIQAFWWHQTLRFWHLTISEGLEITSRTQYSFELYAFLNIKGKFVPKTKFI